MDVKGIQAFRHGGIEAFRRLCFYARMQTASMRISLSASHMKEGLPPSSTRTRTSNFRRAPTHPERAPTNPRSVIPAFSGNLNRNKPPDSTESRIEKAQGKRKKKKRTRTRREKKHKRPRITPEPSPSQDSQQQRRKSRNQKIQKSQNRK